jgi:hypothetical protein
MRKLPLIKVLMATSLSVSATSLTLMHNGHPFEKADQKILDFAFESGLYNLRFYQS